MTNATDNRIDEDMVRYFVWAIWNFFSRVTSVDPEVEAPYLLSKLRHNDYTGAIGVSGNQHGAVYFTMGRPLLVDLYKNHYGKSVGDDLEDLEEHELEELLEDSAGEMANTVSGNVRNFLGEDFLISTPIVVKSQGDPLSMPQNSVSIVFPIKWSEHVCHLVVSLKTNEPVSS